VGRELVEAGEAQEVFESSHDVERWDVRDRNGDVQVEQWTFDPPEGSESPATDDSDAGGERYVILTVTRGSTTSVMSTKFELRTGDTAAIAMHSPDRDEAERLLERAGWKLSLPDTEPGAYPTP
jgi:hypothetical protein